MPNNGYQQVFSESVSAVTATASVEVGSRRREALNEYVYVYNMSTSTIDVGLGAVYSTSSGYSVTVSSITGDACAGVVKNAQIGPEEYGWLCTKGPCSCEVGGDDVGGRTAATGDILALMSVGEFYPIVAGSAGTGTTWSAFQACAVCVETIATGASGTAMLNCNG